MRQRWQGKTGQRRQDQGLGRKALLGSIRLLQPEVPSDSKAPKGSKNQIAASGARQKDESLFIYRCLGALARAMFGVGLFCCTATKLLDEPGNHWHICDVAVQQGDELLRSPSTVSPGKGLT
jgi:hypothetical protein